VEKLGTLLPSVKVPPPGPISRSMAQRLSAVETRNVTFLSEDVPVFWEEARGANVRDPDGNVFLDLSGAFGVAIAGHSHPAVVDRISAQAGRLVHGMGDIHPPSAKLELLEALVALAPWADARATLASTGSEAVEVALKTALLASKRSGIVAFEGSYHGLTLGSLATTSRSHFRDPFSDRLYAGVAFAPFPDPRVEGESDRSLEIVEDLLSRGTPTGAGVGCVIVEPIQGRAGIRIPPPDFLGRLANLTASFEAILVFDEIFTGFGRSGTLFALQHEGVLPDVVCLGKTMAGGLPLSACVGGRAVMEAWPPSNGEAIHTSTFLGHPLACASALAFMEVLEEERLVERAASLGESLLLELRAELEGVPWVAEVRGRGLLLGIELADPNTDGPWREGAAIVAVAALREGVIVLPAGELGEVVELAPPAVLTEEQAGWAVETLARVIREIAPRP
jgi:4-aminobutyrate aminotransferase-like enzyme